MIHSYTYPLNHPTLKRELFRLQLQRAALAQSRARFMEMAVMQDLGRSNGIGKR